MGRPKVFVTRHLPGRALDFIDEHCELRLWEEDRPVSAEVLSAEASTADGLLTLLTDRVDEAMLSRAPRLRVVSNMATGFDNVDVEACSRHGVVVTRTPGVLSETTADFAFALMLAAARRIVEADGYVRSGKWKTWGPEAFLGHDVHGATLGIVGMGGIGREVAKRARGFGMTVLYNSRTPRPDLEEDLGMTFVPLDELLKRSDFVTLHAPLTPETRHLISERELRAMKESAVLVNTARGPLVDQPALYRALNERWIAAAALDVTDPEPILADDPLLALNNVVIAPHIASASVATRSKMAMLAAEQLVSALAGNVPQNAVNPEAWTRRQP
jgi:glyoxylate reductase